MEKNVQSTAYLKYFIIVVILAAFVSILFKGYSLVKSSTFKYDTFNLLIIGKDAHLIHLDDSLNSLTRVDIKNGRRDFINKSQIIQSAKLGILLDGVIILPPDESFTDEDFISLSNTLDYILLENAIARININELDMIKIYLASKQISQKDREIIKLDRKGIDIFSQSVYSKKFADNAILNEKASVRVINATDIDGFGNAFSNSLKNLGYNIVDLETSDKQDSKVLIDSNFPDSYGRIINALRIRGVKNDSTQIADLTIVLGPDILK